jgi:small subunit ribosomal protein S6
MLVLRSEGDVTEKSATELVEKLVGTEAKVAGVSLLGKKMLAYPIQKKMEGTYVLVKLEGKEVRVGEIEKKVQMGTEVLRYLLTAVN